jgi:uncharacterized membrane protein (UPF0127 family)
MRLLPIVALCLALAACSGSSDPVRDFSAREVKLPDGKAVTVEVMTNPTDMSRGMMFRDSLDPSRGMLFIHGSANRFPYWMYQVKIPLDIIWIDQNRRVVEISANTPPCNGKSANECPNYGGHEPALYVLELGGGEAAKHGIQVGSYLSF